MGRVCEKRDLEHIQSERPVKDQGAPSRTSPALGTTSGLFDGANIQLLSSFLSACIPYMNSHLGSSNMESSSDKPAALPALPDLDSIPGHGLRKLPLFEVREREDHGLLYTKFFRELQIRPAKYDDFYDGVIQFSRNKHLADIKLCSNASIKRLTDLLLRAFGYIVWKEGSDWLLEETELAEGEVTLVHVRGEGIENPKNARYVQNS